MHATPDLLNFVDFILQRSIIVAEPALFSGKLGMFRSPCLDRQGGPAVHDAFGIAFGGFKERDGFAMLFRKHRLHGLTGLR